MKAIVHNEYGNEAVLTIAETAKPAFGTMPPCLH